jgi:hypothetical protein
MSYVCGYMASWLYHIVVFFGPMPIMGWQPKSFENRRGPQFFSSNGRRPYLLQIQDLRLFSMEDDLKNEPGSTMPGSILA